jgi:hypothetical protein
MSEKTGIGDLLGIAPVARAVERVTDSVVGGAEALLGRVCLPAAEEFGLLLRDKVSGWQQQNLLSTVAKAQPLLEVAASQNRHAPPRLIMETLNHASWAESGEVQEMWAGLFASSCTANAADDSNWIFINLLGQLIAMQAYILKTACETAPKVLQPNGLITADELYRTGNELVALTGCTDVQRIDRELDHLRVLGLISFGFRGGFQSEPWADIRPTTLALHLYVRAQGSLQNPIEYFGLVPGDAEQGAPPDAHKDAHG